MVKYELPYNNYRNTGVVSNESGPVNVEIDSPTKVLGDLVLSATIGHTLANPLTGIEGMTSVASTTNAVAFERTLSGMGTVVAYGEVQKNKHDGPQK